MPLAYQAGESTGPVRQGEVLGPIVLHEALFPPRRIPKSADVLVGSTKIDLALVLSPDCDLTWDYDARFNDFERRDDAAQAVESVLMCQLHSRAEIRGRFQEQGDLWRRVEGNHDRRYHHIPGAAIAESGAYLHSLYLDFKKVISVPSDRLYDGVLAGDIERIALLPEYYVHHLIHRFYGFLSRVALPDEQSE
jgi:hypothetical protein